MTHVEAAADQAGRAAPTYVALVSGGDKANLESGALLFAGRVLGSGPQITADGYEIAQRLPCSRNGCRGRLRLEAFVIVRAAPKRGPAWNAA